MQRGELTPLDALVSQPSMTRNNLIQFSAVALVCIQSAFLFPYIILLHGERTNLFTPTLALIALCVVLFCKYTTRTKNKGMLWQKWEPYAWLAFVGLTMVAGGLSLERTSSLYRSFAFCAPALGGYWCGRLTSDETLWNRYSTGLFTVMFTSLSVGQILYGPNQAFIGVHHHAMTNMLIVLGAGPLTLFVRTKNWRIKLLSLSILSLGFCAAFIIGSRFTILLPFVLFPILTFSGYIKKRYSTLAIVLFLGLAALFFTLRPSKIPQLKNYESVFYRVEGIPTAIHIVKQHPFFGIGIRASRAPYLENYTILSGLTDKTSYMRIVKNNVTSDNMFTTLLVGLGLIPTALYMGMIGIYSTRLIKTFKLPQKEGLANTMIGLTLVCCLIHFSVQDGLLHPQINWYFHFMIGLVPIKHIA